MAKPIFTHNYTPISERPVYKEPMDAKNTKTERAGFVSMEKRIHSIMQAGTKLDLARREQYHFGEDSEIDPNFTDYSIDPSLDISEVATNVQEDSDVMLSKAEAKKQAKAQKLAEAAKAEALAEARKEIEAEAQTKESQKLDSAGTP